MYSYIVVHVTTDEFNWRGIQLFKNPNMLLSQSYDTGRKSLRSYFILTSWPGVGLVMKQPTGNTQLLIVNNQTVCLHISAHRGSNLSVSIESCVTHAPRPRLTCLALIFRCSSAKWPVGTLEYVCHVPLLAGTAFRIMLCTYKSSTSLSHCFLEETIWLSVRGLVAFFHLRTELFLGLTHRWLASVFCFH